MSLDELGQRVHANNIEKGFWDGTIDINFILAKLALVHSELSEILEAVRKEQGDAAIAAEFADVVIRLTDLYIGMQEHGWLSVAMNLDGAIEEKVSFNETRPKMHGNLI